MSSSSLKEVAVEETKSTGRYAFFHKDGKEYSLLYGFFCWFSFLFVWIGSISLPICGLAIGIFSGNALYIALGCLMCLLALYMAYEDSNPTVKKHTDFFHYGMPRFFSTISLKYEQEPDPERKTVFAVHPHGIFCVGWSVLTTMKEMGHVFFCVASSLYELTN